MSATEMINSLRASGDPALVTFNRGIEREALRVTPMGNLATTPHPSFLGSKLTHPLITTDFCESQPELITPVHTTPEGALAQLDLIHRYIYANLKDEILWSASMPCVLQDNDRIPLAYYGESNLGRLKTTYRNGLGYRYGRGMQTICAIHYNFSLPDSFWTWHHESDGGDESRSDFQTRRYFDLMRNFRRYSWLLTYLFGASPAVCNSFLRGREHTLSTFDEGTAFLPHATSLRSGSLGYQSDTQADRLYICYNSVENYVLGLAEAICEEYPLYKEIGTLVVGEYRQVNANVLQSEAEFYSSIRAKRVPPKGENFLTHLLKDGVEYIEVRLLDVNPYLPLGIDTETIKFLDTFLAYCLLEDSPQHDDQLCDEVRVNSMATVRQGRSPDVEMMDQGQARRLPEWGGELLTALEPVADLLDEMLGGSDYRDSVNAQKEKISDATLTPSGSILMDMESEQIPFFKFAMDLALEHRYHFTANPPTQADADSFEKMAVESVAAQQAIEDADQISFDQYLDDIQQGYVDLIS